MVQCQRILRDGLYPSLSAPRSLTQQTRGPVDHFTEMLASLLDDLRASLRKALGVEG
jgi:hypothetical protein